MLRDTTIFSSRLLLLLACFIYIFCIFMRLFPALLFAGLVLTSDGNAYSRPAATPRSLTFTN